MEPAARGATRIADRVVAKIASQAAREALDEEPGGPGGGTGAGGGADGRRTPPLASVTVHEETARVRVSVELGYPADIGAHCRAVRRRIAERVRALAGMEVPEVVITVERLHSPHMERGTVERVR
ncbi:MULTISPECIES: Asp23/Gls24 family envelope stress response protein [Streptomyces]|uniref:Asp23/Gls24 family envelope stress response protein n=1 Tax=Streptomyces TaxID=1883 RepID=UPI00163BFDE0|nr:MULTISPECIES: Asp23/Gls24 family envelope stress response protein [Streptomyces]MBC2879393.1 Asp23/Gls24 family envelope stress response protein [Streptomyces sp. TYQ1024]UBI39561.1 Asp23/Gls24 family envelope stress response protein [Streptomyces mobaraensis]UKW32140.1 Asp23/Gls24 family envelope stress response protein [Streptomyces sp. TYQ1024]